MALIVEDGGGRAEACSYVGLAEADGYHGRRGQAGWAAASVEQREAALVKASDCLDAVYAFRGERLKAEQALAWPRAGAEDNAGVLLTGVPAVVRRACAELALRALSEELLPDLARGGRVRGESVGPVSVSYFDGAPAGTVRRLVDGLLRGVVRAGCDLARA